MAKRAALSLAHTAVGRRLLPDASAPMLVAVLRTQGGPGPASASQVCVRAGESAPPGRPATRSGARALCALPGGCPAASTRGPAPAPGSGREPSRRNPTMSGGPEPRPCGGDAARDPTGLWLELGPACPGAPRCPSESSGPTSGDLGTSSGSSSTGLSPGSDSDSSGVVCGGRAGGMRGAPSRSRSLESLRSASAGKGASCSPAPSGLAAASPRPSQLSPSIS